MVAVVVVVVVVAVGNVRPGRLTILCVLWLGRGFGVGGGGVWRGWGGVCVSKTGSI